MLFEVKDHDLAARICKVKTNNGQFETPTIMPVINPGKQLIKAKDMPRYGAEILITNAYFLWKDFPQEAIDRGVHDLLQFQGPIMTDSGAYQYMEYGDIGLKNKDIIRFQEKIGVDIGVILDQPTSSTERKDVENSVTETLKTAKASKALIEKSSVDWCGPIQGLSFPRLFEKSLQEMAKLPFSVHAIGSVVPLLMRYEFATVTRALAKAKELLPQGRLVHLFGAGHPMFFSFAAALGVDLFDSAAYALYAADDRYMTQTGTEKLADLKYFPCSCPVCSKYTPEELAKNKNKEKLLAEHNLYITFEELRVIKQAIRDKTLWELLEQRARSHPALLDAMRELIKHTKLINEFDPITKKHFFHVSDLSKYRPELSRVGEHIKGIKADKAELPLFGQVPRTVIECYPFAQLVVPKEEEFEVKKEKDIEKVVRDTSRYWFGTDVFPDNIRGERSRKTGKLRSVKSATKLLVTVRANDFMFLLHDAAPSLHKKTKYPKHRVVMADNKEIQGLVSEGKTVFAPHIKDCDPDIIPGQQVLVVTKKDKLLAAGEAVLCAREMKELEHGMAVKTRWTIKN